MLALRGASSSSSEEARWEGVGELMAEGEKLSFWTPVTSEFTADLMGVEGGGAASLAGAALALEDLEVAARASSMASLERVNWIALTAGRVRR